MKPRGPHLRARRPRRCDASLCHRPAAGGIIKRDPDAVAYWAEQSLARPMKDETHTDMVIRLARLLTETDDPQQRARGIRLLEASINNPYAKAALGEPSART